MTHCTRCGRALPTSLDEYGPDLQRPLCWACWQEDEREVERARDEPEHISPEWRNELLWHAEVRRLGL